jgi:hypothetical protein
MSAALPVSLVATIMLSIAGQAGRSASAAANPHRLVLYSRAEQEQYVNNQDDRMRGHGHNPFGNYRDTSPGQQQSPNGPFPGDEAIFSFNLYTDAGLTRRAGTASFTCQYNFDKNAFCNAVFRLRSGETLLAEGSFDFHASSFTLAVTAPTKGTLEEKPSARHGQKLTFELT